MKIGKSDLTDIDRIDQSVEIDDTLLSFIDLLDFTDSIDFIWRYICSSVPSHPKMKTDFMQTVNLLTMELQLKVEGSDNLLSLFKKKCSKKFYIFFKTRFKVSFWWPILARFVGAQFFHDLDLPPFQNNISSTCSYLPKSIKIVSDQVILSSNNGKQWKAI